MARTMSKSDLRLFNYTDIASVDHGRWSAWTAKVAAGLSAETHRFIYLKSDCTHADGLKAMQHISGKTFVVYPGREREQPRWLKGIVPPGIESWALGDMLWKAIDLKFNTYLSNLKDRYPSKPHFITPHPEGRARDDLSGIIKDWIVNQSPADNQQIRVLLAPAGVGKTTVARHLVWQIASASDTYRKIPIYLESEHWRRVSVDSLDSLWRTIDQSLRLFDPDLRLDEPMFDHLLQQGDIVFVFDGFDELCGHPDSPLSPAVELHRLVDSVAPHADARVLLTSRTNYWESEVGPSFPETSVMRLATFSPQQAARYLEKRFPDQKKLQRARSLLGALRTENQPDTPGGGKNQLPYHPFVVEMVADAVNSNDHDLVLNESVEGRSEMFGVLRAFCEREVNRRNVKTSADGQIAALQGIAVEACRKPDSEEFALEDFVIMGFERQDIDRLEDHPLLRRSTSDLPGERAGLKYSFMKPLLVARYLIGKIRAVADGRGEWTDESFQVADRLYTGKIDVLDHLSELWPDDLAIETIGKALDRVPASQRHLQSLLFHVAMVVSRLSKPSLNRAERSEHVFSAIHRGQRDASGTLVVSDLAVYGTISDLGLLNTTFRNCFFCSVTFSKCQVGSTTTLEQCRFEGELDADPRTGWPEIVVKDVTCDPDADLVFHDLTAQGPGGRESRIRKAMKAALQRFVHSGMLTETIAQANWNRGKLGKLQIGQQVKEVFRRVGLIDEIATSSVTEGCLTIDRGSLEDIQKFLDSGALAGKVRAAYDLLQSEL